jgi:hypothetical protein
VRLRLTDVTIKGRLTIGREVGSKAEQDIFVEPYFTGCDFEERVHINRCNFKNSFVVIGCNFHSGIRIMYSTLGKVIITGKCSALAIWFSKIGGGNFVFTSVDQVGLMFTTFDSYCSLGDSRFAPDGHFDVVETAIEKDCNFAAAELPPAASSSQVKFGGKTDFTGAFVGDLSFSKCTFSEESNFNELNVPHADEATEPASADASASGSASAPALRYPKQQGSLSFDRVSFGGRASFNRSRLDQLSIGAKTGKVYMVGVAKEADFGALRCRDVSLVGVDFAGGVTFAGSTITHSFILQRVNFGKEVNIQGARFPNVARGRKSISRSGGAEIWPTGIVFGEILFGDAVRGQWKQLVQRKRLLVDDKLKVASCPSESWFSLSDAFKRAGNLKGENEAAFRGHLAEGFEQNAWANWFSWAFWGFGYRPMRVVLWLTLATLGFACIYCRETDALAIGKPWLSGLFARYRFSVLFSARTAWSLLYGYNNSKTLTVKILTVTQSILSKIMLICLLPAIANVSPLLNAIVGKFLGA